MSFSVDELARIAIDLQSDIGHTDRFSRLITTLRQILGCDASALLRYEAHQFVPLAIDGLAQDVLGRRFALDGHPRLEAIARAGDVVRFPAPDGSHQYAGVVIEEGGDWLLFDFNHPLAGQPVTFEVQVIGIL